MKVLTKTYSKNSFIYLEGKFSLKEFYIVKSGQIKIIKKTPIFGKSEEIKSTGHIFGIIQCITGITDNESVQALTDCEILIIPKDKIEEVYKNHPKVIYRILQEYSEILRKLDNELVKEELYYSYKDRESKILDLAEKYKSLGLLKHSAHLLKSYLPEVTDKPDLVKIIKQKLELLPNIRLYYSDQIVSDYSFPQDTVIFTEFEHGTNFFIIKKGKVKITKLKDNKEKLLAILQEGDIFGEMAILNNKPRFATAVTAEDTDLMIIDKKGINNLPASLFAKILEILTKRIWFVQQQIICSNLSNPVSKIYFILVTILKQYNVNFSNDIEKSYVFKFSIQELYNLLDIDIDNQKEELKEFLDDKNFEFFLDTIKIKKIGLLYNKYSYHFSRETFYTDK